jgi:hypothetical protein
MSRQPSISEVKKFRTEKDNHTTSDKNVFYVLAKPTAGGFGLLYYYEIESASKGLLKCGEFDDSKVWVESSPERLRHMIWEYEDLFKDFDIFEVKLETVRKYEMSKIAK